MRQIAILGQTASGKSDLALNIADKIGANILSLDSLSIYKEIDIASAKPSKKELLSLPHFGIDEIYPNEKFSIFDFVKIYQNAKKESIQNSKNLIIVGGSSFYLHSMIDGLSAKPHYGIEIEQKAKDMMMDKESIYKMLYDIDEIYMQKIKPNDTYRIEKALLLYLASDKTPTEYFALNPKKPLIKQSDIEIFEIAIEKDVLKDRIKSRTKKMIETGLIEETKYLKSKYGKEIAPINSIGLKESLEYIDGNIKSKEELENTISTNTRKLAKRQKTFNNSKFKIKRVDTKKSIESLILSN
jgi:tRNA dimethylallyltransferase